MKKTLLIVGIILALIVALPVINLIRWTFQSKKPLNIILVDKTVPNLERLNHKSFNWILLNERFVKKEKKTSYSYRKDYYGFYPQKPLRDRKWDRNDYRLTDLINLADSNDAVYFADTYGVATSDWYRSFYKVRRSRKIYGGLNNNDFLLIKEMKDRNKLVIMEYNSFDYPTAPFESVRTQEKLGISFTGWSGRYFNTLDTIDPDFPIWMTAMYRKGYKKPWAFSKPGIVLLRDKSIIVLEEGTHLATALPQIITSPEYVEKYGLAESVAFEQWFDIVDPLENTVISKYKIATTPIGDTLLAGYNLMSEFPAVTQESVTKTVFYFSGNFASSEVPYWISRFKGVDKLKGILYSDKPEDPRRFFWLYYRPLVNGIFTEYYESKKAK